MTSTLGRVTSPYLAARTLDPGYYNRIFKQFLRARDDVQAQLRQLPHLGRTLRDLKLALYAQPVQAAQLMRIHGPRVYATMEAIRAHVARLVELGRVSAELNAKLKQEQAGQRAEFGIVPFVVWGIAGAVATVLGLYAIHTVGETSLAAQRVELGKVVQELQREGTDPQVIAALTGVYDGIGGQVALGASSLTKAALVGAAVYIAAGYLGKKK